MTGATEQARMTAARTVSLGAALAISVLILLAPGLLGRMTALTHTVLPLALLGVSGGFVHGIGYTPDNSWLRLLFGPAVAWPLMALYPALIAAALAV